MDACVNCEDALIDAIMLPCGHAYHAFCYTGFCNLCHVFDDVIQTQSESNHEPGKLPFFEPLPV